MQGGWLQRRHLFLFRVCAFLIIGLCLPASVPLPTARADEPAPLLVRAVQSATSAAVPEEPPALVLEEGSSATTAVDASGVIGPAVVARPQSPSRWIVRLREPADAGPRRPRASSRDEARQVLERFRARIAALEGSGAGTIRVRRELHELFPVAVVEASEEAAERMRALAEVESVVPDSPVRACLADATRIVHADTYWSALGTTGAGVTVAVVDSGIDYRHPDLGGGIGPGFKVRGGFDFVNDDADPMDDYGHGTHVAGIIAADGGVRGVAFGAQLLAYKVLDRRGFGSLSSVLAALDRIADPDGDPATDDLPEVVNLSLGGPASHDDPLLPAIRLLRSRGVLCVVAAGNDGPSYGTITSPGVSEDALTVGAVDKADGIARFSSRGPTPQTHGIKPEIVAPGVGIRSAWVGGGYRVLSGTSMAAAVASGAAALVSALHPGASAAARGSLLATSALPLPPASPVAPDPWSAGTGRLDLERTIGLAALAGTASLHFGIDDSSLPRYRATRRLRIVGRGIAPLAMRARIEGALPEGAAFSVEPSQWTLGPGERREISITLDVDGERVPDAASEPYAYGSVLVLSADGAIDARLPLQWFKTPELTIRFDVAPWTLLLHDRTGKGRFLVAPGARTSRLLPRATYDLLALFPDASTLSAVEGVALDRSLTVDVRRADAVHALALRPLDESGGPLPGVLGALEVRHAPSGVSQILVGAISPRLSFSTLGSDYRIGASLQDHVLGTLYQVAASRLGIDADSILSNDPVALRRTRLQIAPLPGSTPEGALVRLTSWLSYLNRTLLLQLAFFRNSADVSAPYETDLVLSPPPDAAFPFFVQGWLSRTEPPGAASPFRVTPYLDGGDAAGIRGLLWGGEAPVLSGVESPLRTGLGPPRFHARLRNVPDAVRIDAADGHLNFFFLDAVGDFVPGTGLRYELLRGGEVVGSGPLPSAGGDGTGAYVEEIPVVAGEYGLRLVHDRYAIGGETGRATATLRFDTRRAAESQGGDADPPILSRFAVLDARGQPADEIDPFEGSAMRFDLRDDSAIARVAAFARVGSLESSLPIDDLGGGAFRVALSGLPSNVAVSLRLVAEDAAGNSLDWLVEPGVRTRARGGPPPSILAVTPNHASVAGGEEIAVVGAAFAPAESVRVQVGGLDALDVRVIDETRLSFRAPAAASAGPVDVTVSNEAGRAVLVRGFLRVEMGESDGCRGGNVNVQNGPPARVLAVDGGTGDGFTVRLEPGQPFDVVLIPSPAGPVPARFVLYVYESLPGEGSATPQPYGLGTACFPTPLTGHASKVRVIANTLGHRGRLGEPEREAAPAPESIRFPRGIRGPAAVTVQGLLEDAGSAGPGVSLTNAAVIWVP